MIYDGLHRLTLDLNMIPGLQRPEDWAVPGPGAQSGLRLIFGEKVVGHYAPALVWLYENQQALFKRAGITHKDIPGILPSRPGLTLIDLEHALCETHKYVAIRHRGPNGIASRTYKSDSTTVTCRLPPRWKETALAAGRRDKKYNRPQAAISAVDVDDSLWYISHIVDKEKITGELHYRLRWHGYGPHEDTWESVDRLIEDAPTVVEEYEQLIGGIEDTLLQFRHTP